MTENPIAPHKRNIKQAIVDEAKKALVLSVYFGVWFCALAFLAATELVERPIPLTIFGLAIIKAALTAKFMLIGQAVFPIRVSKHHGIVISLLLESFVYLAIVLALNYVEAGVDGVIHGKNFIDSLAAFGQADPLKIFAMSILYWLIVMPYLIFVGALTIMGRENFIILLFGTRNSADR